MISAATLHVVATEMTVGTLALAGALILLRTLISLDKGPFSNHAYSIDTGSVICAIAGLIAMPFAIITGITASPGDGLDDPLLFNKVILTFTALGIWGAWLSGRRSMGAAVWDDRGLALMHGLMGLTATGLTLTVASLGGKFSRGESLLGPLVKPLEYIVSIGMIPSIIMLIASIAAFSAAIRVMPRIETQP